MAFMDLYAAHLITEIAHFYKISRNHLVKVKVVHNLILMGFVETTRGKNGGISKGCRAYFDRRYRKKNRTGLESR